jgi:hypothetical protein
MRMLFSSSDIAEIGRVGREFLEAGIPCGVRYDPPREGLCPAPAHAELWVQSETDFHRAVLLYLRLTGNSDAKAINWSPELSAAEALRPPAADKATTSPGYPANALAPVTGCSAREALDQGFNQSSTSRPGLGGK